MHRLIQRLFLFFVFGCASLAMSASALADKVHLKDGRVLEGAVVRETDTFIQIKVKVGGIESIQTVLKADIKSHERDTPAAAAPAAAKKDESAPAGGPAPASGAKPAAQPGSDSRVTERARKLDSTGTRVAILNFGPPSSWHGEVGDTIGIQINAAAWRAVVPMLEKDKVDAVVVRINSGGGYLFEEPKFHDLFENVYKKKFRTVAWVESAISAAAMSPYVIEEFYFMPNGSLGACTGWYGALQNVEGIELEESLAMMEHCSALGRRSPAIMRAMQIQVPLSATIDKVTGEVTWYQDTTGEHLLNPSNQIYTMTANDAVKFKFARGIASTREELAEAMGITEVVWAGEDAARHIDDNMRQTDRTEKRWQLSYAEYQLNRGYAEQAQDRKDRGKFVGRALSAIREMRAMFKSNPNFSYLNGINAGWFQEVEEELKRMLRE